MKYQTMFKIDAYIKRFMNKGIY